MSNKQEIIKQMLEMQKMFIDYEHKNGVDPQDYYAASEGHPLHHYREKYNELAKQVNSMAHEDKGSKA